MVQAVLAPGGCGICQSRPLRVLRKEANLLFHPPSGQQQIEEDHPTSPEAARRSPSKGRVQVRVIEFQYQAEKWNKPRRVVCKIEWHVGELFPHVGFIVTNSSLEADRVITVYNGRAEIEISQHKCLCSHFCSPAPLAFPSCRYAA